jgi:hypothetical protein
MHVKSLVIYGIPANAFQNEKKKNAIPPRLLLPPSMGNLVTKQDPRRRTENWTA